MTELLIYMVIVGVIAVAGIRLGMLMASFVGRIADRIDADPDDTPTGTEPRDDA